MRWVRFCVFDYNKMDKFIVPGVANLTTYKTDNEAKTGDRDCHRKILSIRADYAFYKELLTKILTERWRHFPSEDDKLLKYSLTWSLININMLIIHFKYFWCILITQ